MVQDYQNQMRKMRKELRAQVGENRDLQGSIRRKQYQINQQIKYSNDQKKQLIQDNEDIKGLIRYQEQQINQLNNYINHNKQSNQSDPHYEDIKGMLRKHQDNVNKQIKQSYKILFIERYKNKYQKLAQLVVKQQGEMNELIRIISGPDINVIQQLKQSNNEVDIYDYMYLDEYKKRIEQYQQYSKQYRIQLDFQNFSMNSIDSKMDVLQMINTLNANSNVGIVRIILNSSNKWNSEIVRLMINRFTNVYYIYVHDINDSVDHQIHNQIKRYVQQQPIMKFKLMFWLGSLQHNDDGYELIKQYNQLIKQKQYLKWLDYEHDRIGGQKIADTKQKIEELIDEVDKQ